MFALSDDIIFILKRLRILILKHTVNFDKFVSLNPSQLTRR
jgi:hypothetical protein